LAFGPARPAGRTEVTMSNGSQAATPKKGLSTLAWVGIGCGCLLLIAAVTTAAFFLFVAKKVHDVAGDFKKNPTLAAARLVVKANPDLEEAGVDEKAGTITIRNKKTGELVTVSFEDVKQGRLSFTTDKGTVTLQGDQAGGKLDVSGTGDKGGFHLRAGAGDSATIPDWVPTYPGVSPTGSFAMEQDGAASGGFEVTTPDAVDVVLEHFRQELKKAGFEVHVNTFAGDGATQGGMLNGEDQVNKRKVTVTVARQEGGSSATVAYSTEK
jgi:hypothetical protein